MGRRLPVSEVRAADLEAWSTALGRRRKRSGELLAPSTTANLLYAAKGFFGSLRERRLIRSDPSTAIVVRSPPRPLPRSIPSPRGVLGILDGPDRRTRLGVRDRAILELLYSTGLRRGEVVRLCIDDVDLEGLTVLVRRGKGGRDRVVPMGGRAAGWITRYLRSVRPHLATEASGAILFLGRRGSPIGPTTLGDRLRTYVAAAGHRGACHVFRHACATHMLEGGADIRHLQEQLGHARIATTQIYAHVTIGALKAVHETCHPLGGAERRRGREEPRAGARSPAALRLASRRALSPARRPRR
jgi:integrase/recombinase XerD